MTVCWFEQFRDVSPDLVWLADVIAATPDVKYRTSILVWIVLALLIALVVAMFAIPYFAGRR